MRCNIVIYFSRAKFSAVIYLDFFPISRWLSNCVQGSSPELSPPLPFWNTFHCLGIWWGGGWEDEVDGWMHRFAAGWQEGIEAAAQRRNLLATYPTRVLHATNQRRTRPITAPRLSSTNESAPPGRGCARRPWPTNQSVHTWLHCTTLGSCKHHMSFIKLYSRRFLAAWYYKFFQATAVKQPSTH